MPGRGSWRQQARAVDLEPLPQDCPRVRRRKRLRVFRAQGEQLSEPVHHQPPHRVQWHGSEERARLHVGLSRFLAGPQHVKRRDAAECPECYLQ